MARKKKMSAAVKRKLAAYATGKKKPMSKRALAAKRRKIANATPRYKTGPKKGQFKPKRAR